MRGFHIRGVCSYFGRLTKRHWQHLQNYLLENLIWQQHVEGNRVRTGTKIGMSCNIFQVKCNIKDLNLDGDRGIRKEMMKTFMTHYRGKTDRTWSLTKGRKGNTRNQIQHWDFKREWQRGLVTEVGILGMKQAVENMGLKLRKSVTNKI